jgi:hypothetical protein
MDMMYGSGLYTGKVVDESLKSSENSDLRNEAVVNASQLGVS